MPPAPTRRKHTKLLQVASLAKDAFLETLWPTRCALCDAPGNVLCKKCQAALTYVDANRACPRCGAPYGQHLCTECNDTVLEAAGIDALPLDGLASALLADHAAIRIVTTYKDANERRLAPLAASMTARYIPPEWKQATITFIPATKRALRKRGFDHGETFAREVALAASMEFACLFMRPHHADQRAFDRRQRLKNMEESFTLRQDAALPRDVVIVDDVCTTGATLFAAAHCLKAAGVKRVFGLTFAKVLAS